MILLRAEHRSKKKGIIIQLLEGIAFRGPLGSPRLSEARTEAKQWRTPQRRNRATLRNKRSIQTQQENLSRTTGNIHRYFQPHMQLQSCDNERQAVKLMVTLGAYGHDSDAYSIQSSLPSCQAWEHRLPNCIEGSLSHVEKVTQHLMHPSPHMPSCTTATVTNVHI